MLPLFKVFSLVVRVFSRPVVNYLKTIHKSNYKNIGPVSKFLMSLGNKHHRMEVFINRKMMNLKTDSDMFVKPLSPEISLEKGIEFFYEICFYSIILSIAGFELLKTQMASEEKKEKDEKRLQTIEARIAQTSTKLEEIQADQVSNLKEFDGQLKIVQSRVEKCIAKQKNAKELEKEMGEVKAEIESTRLQVQAILEGLKR